MKIKNKIIIFLIISVLIYPLSACNGFDNPPAGSGPLGNTYYNVEESEGLEYELRKDGTSYAVIGRGSFEGSVLKIPENYNGFPVKEIGNSAFFADQSLKAIILPEKTEVISNSAFINCKNLVDVKFNNKLKRIEESAFFGCMSIDDIYIPDSVKEIGKLAFYQCSSLKSLYISQRIQKILPYTFSMCYALESITIPGSVEEIHMEAFASCTSLKEVFLPANMSKLAIDAFIHCPSLEKIEVDKNNQKYFSSGNCIIEKETKNLVLGCKNSVIPDDGSVCKINTYAFYGKKIMADIKIPDSITRIEQDAFYDTLTSPIVTEPVIVDNWLICGTIQSEQILPENILGIADSAFESNPTLTSLTLPEGLKHIGQNAFSWCENIIEITFPSSLETIESEAFSYCRQLQYINYNGTKAEWKNISYNADSLPNLAKHIKCTDGTVYLYIQ